MGFDLFVKIVGVVSATLAIGTTILRIASRNFGYSPKRRKYWIARLESSVEEYDKTGGQQGFDDRIVDVRCQAEGFEAARSMGVDSRIVNWGIGTVLIVAAILLAFFWSGWDPASVTASNSEGGWTLPRSIIYWVMTGFLAILGIVYFAWALMANDLMTRYSMILYYAGKFGHSSLVRSDPWTLVATYEEWAGEGRDEVNERQKKWKSFGLSSIKYPTLAAVFSAFNPHAPSVVPKDIWGSRGELKEFSQNDMSNGNPSSDKG